MPRRGVLWVLLCGFLIPTDGYVDLIVAVLIACGARLRALVAGARARASPGSARSCRWSGLQPPHFVDLAVLPVLYATASLRRHRSCAASVSISALVGAGSSRCTLSWSLPMFGRVVDDVPDDRRVGTRRCSAWCCRRSSSRSSSCSSRSAVMFVLSWTLGLLARTWRNAREARIAAQVAERSVVVEQERNRLARDMHDVVAHSLAVVIAQADGARYTKDPIASADALATISATAREALTDVRLLLGQLRHSQEAGPQPRVADLERLIDQVRDAGLTITVDEVGDRPELHASQALAVYRILQEALTNALRHGDTAKPVRDPTPLGSRHRRARGLERAPRAHRARARPRPHRHARARGARRWRVQRGCRARAVRGAGDPADQPIGASAHEHDPGRPRRRPVPVPRRHPHARLVAARPRVRGGGRRRGRRGRARRRERSRCRAHGHPHAHHGRRRRHQGDPRGCRSAAAPRRRESWRSPPSTSTRPPRGRSAPEPVGSCSRTPSPSSCSRRSGRCMRARR